MWDFLFIYSTEMHCVILVACINFIFQAMKKMSSTDTPLNTVARMQEKQKTLQSAYIVLSGGSKTMTA